MLRKILITTAVAAALGLPTAALAGPHGGHHGGHGGWHHGGHHGGWRHGGWHGGPGRWWGGRYWAYGVGSCWRWNPYTGGWIWVCY
jgi:hypothetical protein